MIDWLKSWEAVVGFGTIALVALTAFIAWLTCRMRAADEKRTEASIKVAEEMREQTVEAKRARSQQIRPVVRVVHFTGCKGDQALARRVCSELTVRLRNEGGGAATNGVARIEWGGWPITEHSAWSLGPNEERGFTFARGEGEAQETGEAEARMILEYDDMHGIRWRSARELCVENDAGVCHLDKEFGPKEVPHD